MDHKYKKNKDGAYLCNYIIRRRENDPAKWLAKRNKKTGQISVGLNGYAIIPIDEYMKLGNRPEKSISKIMVEVEKADEQLHCRYNFSNTMKGFFKLLRNFGDKK